MKLISIIKNPKPYFLVASNRIINMYRTYFYRGNIVFCEICKWQGMCFFKNKCPKCNSLPRTRLVPYSIKYFHLAEKQPKILHIAPNLNEFNYIQNNVTKLSNYDRLNIKPVGHINIVQDLTNSTLESSQYDLAIAWHVLEHIPEDTKAITEVYRLLKKGGHFLISVPIFPQGNATTYEDIKIPYSDFNKIHGHYDHFRSCGLDYYKRFEKCGFKTHTLNIKSVNSEDITRFGLSKDHVVWCFLK